MNILVIEDDVLIAEFIRRALIKDKHNVSVINDGQDGYEKALKNRFDAIVLDILLPIKNGYDICRDLRQHKVTTPILILSSQSTEDDRISGLDLGADDYLSKPFSHRELSARLRAVTRRPAVVMKSKLAFEDLTLDPESRVVQRAGKIIALSPKEYDLLEYLMRNPNLAIPKHELLNKVWRVRSTSASNRLEVYIRHLRNKIDSNYDKKLIHTVRGVGYKLTA